MAKFDGILIESFWFFLIPECHIDKLKYFLTQKKLEKSFETSFFKSATSIFSLLRILLKTF
jgi:hypothetical protein